MTNLAGLPTALASNGTQDPAAQPALWSPWAQSPGARKGDIQVALLPTIPRFAGESMKLYPCDLQKALEGVPGVRARVEWPSFDTQARAGSSRRWMSYVQYPRWCRALRADIFHVTDHASAQLLLALPPERTVITCHDLYPVAVALGRVKFAGAESPLAMAPTALRLSLLRRVSRVVVISKHTLEECRELLGISSHRLYLAYYGISELFHAENRAQDALALRRDLNLSQDAVVLLHVGSNDPRKNLQAVFGVLAGLRNSRGKSFYLLKAGSAFGPAEKTIMHQFGLEGAVRELGTLAPEETARVFRAADILLYPSYHEGFCRPVAEAMASGTPVVASNGGAIPEVLPSATPLFEPDDVEGMIARVLRILESKTLREELVESGKLAARKFTWAGHGQAVAAAYQTMQIQSAKTAEHVRSEA